MQGFQWRRMWWWTLDLRRKDERASGYFVDRWDSGLRFCVVDFALNRKLMFIEANRVVKSMKVWNQMIELWNSVPAVGCGSCLWYIDTRSHLLSVVFAWILMVFSASMELWFQLSIWVQVCGYDSCQHYWFRKEDERRKLDFGPEMRILLVTDYFKLFNFVVCFSYSEGK